MISFFPNPYPDEILYSVLARYHLRSANTSFKWTLEDLYSSSSVISTIDLPSHIEALCSNIGTEEIYNSKKFIYENTLYSMYAPFLLQSRAEHVYNLMRSDSGRGIHAEVGLSAGGILSKNHLCFCPKCMKDDISAFGEPYWHRTHQVPGVFICIRHHEPLLKYIVLLNQQEYTACPLSISEMQCQELIPSIKDLSVKTKEILKCIADDFEFLLQLSHCPNLYAIKQNILLRLKELGYVTTSNEIRQRKLHEQFQLFYGNELLNVLESSVDSEFSWLAFATRKERRTIHPVRHLLLYRFLYGSLVEFLDEYVKPNHESSIWNEKIQAHSIAPSIKNKKRVKKVRSHRINWELRDLELSVMVEETCKLLLGNKESKPIRITLSTVAKQIGKLSLLQQKKNKLPVTFAVFKQYEETLEQYQIRRVRWVLEQLEFKTTPIKRWEVEKIAGLKAGYSQVVRNEIDRLLHQSLYSYSFMEDNKWVH